MEIFGALPARLGTLPAAPSKSYRAHILKQKNVKTTKKTETTAFEGLERFGENDHSSKIVFFLFSGPPGALRGPNPFSRDPPGASRSAPWSSRGGPKSSQVGPGASKGQTKFTKSACSNPRKYVYLASSDLKKTLSDHFSTLRVPPRDPPVWRPYSSRSPPGPQEGPRELPGTPRSPPGPPQDPLEHP